MMHHDRLVLSSNLSLVLVMVRHLALLGSLAAALLVLGSAVAIADPDRAQPRVYTVSAVQAEIDQAPKHWRERTLLVRGRLEGCPFSRPGPCASWQPVLADARTGPGATTGLPVRLQWYRRPTLPALLRNLAWLGDLVAAPQRLQWSRVATYRVRVSALAGSSPGAHGEAVVLDAEP